MKFFECLLINKSTGLHQAYLLSGENKGDIADFLINEGFSYCGIDNFKYDFKQTNKNNRKFKQVSKQ